MQERTKITKWPSHIYCNGCSSIEPLQIDEMPGTDTSGKFYHPTDLMCSTCKLVLKTVYQDKL